MRKPQLLLAVLALAGALLVPTAAVADTTPTVTVTPGGALQPGQRVTVQGTGFRPSTAYHVLQCDSAPTRRVDRCTGGASKGVTTDAAGAFTTTVRFAAYLVHTEEFGDGRPVFCRADQCQLFVTRHVDGQRQSVGSGPLEMVGEPLTLSLRHTANLPDVSRQRARGTAYGAEGRTVLIGEQVCINIIQGAGCGQDLSTWKPAVVDSTGHFTRRVTVHRFVDLDGRTVDCSDTFQEYCQEGAVVLDAAGNPDYTYGDFSHFGVPGVGLSFSGQG